MVDARLPDGSRVNAIIPPLSLARPDRSRSGSSRAMRSRSTDLVGFGTLDRADGRVPRALRPRQAKHPHLGRHGHREDDAAERRLGLHPRRTSGSSRSRTRPSCSCNSGTSSRSSPGPPNIEGEGEVRIRDLVRNALRMRPDRIIVGEVRGAETLDMLQAMNTGHDGSLTTIHANSARDALHRLEMLVLMAGVELPLQGDPRADRRRLRPRRAHRDGSSTAAAESRRSRRSPAWRATSSRCRTSSSRAPETIGRPVEPLCAARSAAFHGPRSGLPRQAGDQRRRAPGLDVAGADEDARSSQLSRSSRYAGPARRRASGRFQIRRVDVDECSRASG